MNNCRSVIIFFNLNTYKQSIRHNFKLGLEQILYKIDTIAEYFHGRLVLLQMSSIYHHSSYLYKLSSTIYIIKELDKNHTTRIWQKAEDNIGWDLSKF